MNNVVVHVGYPKTATTTFQKHVFPNHPDIDYLGKTIPDMRFRSDELRNEIHRLINEDEVRYEGTQRLKKLMEEHRRNSDRKVLLLSHENFIHHWGNDKGLIARRIREAFGPCKILITLREQLDVIRSFYAMHGRYCTATFLMATQKERVRTPLSLEQWFQFTFRAPERNIYSILHYHDLVSYYVSHFGRENVGVFLYEQFVKDADTYVQQMCRFLKIDPTPALQQVKGKHENRRFTNAEVMYLRIARFCGLKMFDWTQQDAPRWLKYLRNLFGKHEVNIDGEWKTRLVEMYQDGNRKLAELYDLPLGQFGYQVGDRNLPQQQVNQAA